MATKIVTKNSSTASAVPTASDLVQGELAVNVADKRLFTEDNTGTIVELGTNPSTIDINAGSIDGTAIGASSASTGAFTTLTATGAFTSVGIDDNADATAITIDSSENVGIGTSSPEARLHASGGENSVHAVFGTRATRGLEIGTMIGGDGATDNTAFYNMKFSSNGSHVWQAGGSERMRIDSSGNVGIGTSSPISKMQVSGANNGDVFYLTSSDVEDDRGLMFSNSTNGIIWDLDAKGASSLFGQMTFSTNGSERMRIDSSGNVLVGTTSTDPAASGSETGVALKSGGFVSISRNDSAASVNINKIGFDGSLVDFRKGGTTVGSIGTKSGGTLFIAGSSSQNTGIRCYTVGIAPCNSSGDYVDNSRDLGSSTVRWDDVYATNGTIQTSDRNEKQDIAELSDAEQRVAVAAKGLLRKFRWKDSVAEKGDDARIHFGIIAQDLQAAFEAEGLDAGDYAMFISTTWTDEETNEEKTRMGVRYSELLAFIISAI